MWYKISGIPLENAYSVVRNGGTWISDLKSLLAVDIKVSLILEGRAFTLGLLSMKHAYKRFFSSEADWRAS